MTDDMSKKQIKSSIGVSRQTVCVFANSSKVSIRKSDFANLTVYSEDCNTKLLSNTSEVNAIGNSIIRKEIILGITISTVVLVSLSIFITLFCLKRRRMLCFNKSPKNQEIIVHQNELYGNLSNDEYFAERYDTNIVDTNQYYEEEYEA